MRSCTRAHTPPKSKIPSFIPGVTLTNPRVDGRLRGDTLTSRLYVKDPAPGVTILVHGVNDVGEAYPTQEAGICEGLNQRLDRDEIVSHKTDTHPREVQRQRREQ